MKSFEACLNISSNFLTLIWSGIVSLISSSIEVKPRTLSISCWSLGLGPRWRSVSPSESLRCAGIEGFFSNSSCRVRVDANNRGLLTN